MIVAYGGATFMEGLAVQTTTLAEYHRSNILTRVRRDFWSEGAVGDCFYVGAFGRRTAICERGPMRLYVQLPGELTAKQAETCAARTPEVLYQLQSALQHEYGTVYVDARRAAVTVQFGASPRVDVVPVYRLAEGGILTPGPDHQSSWRTGDPLAEIHEITRADESVGGNLLLMCRLMRAWRKRNVIPISSLLLDTLCYEFMERWPFASDEVIELESLSIAFFHFLSTVTPDIQEWSAPGSRTLIPRGGAFEYRARQAYQLCLNAARARTAGRVRESRAIWQSLFGVYV